MAEPLLRLEEVHKSYGTRIVTEVLHGIDLDLGKGEFAALMGPSGSGKSTLLNLVGLLDRPSSGRILFEGRDTTTMGLDERTRFRGRKIGFIFQFHHLLPAFTALENVFLPLAVASTFPRPWMRERAEALLVDVGLSDRLSYRATDLSGGQQQRVAVARALVGQPPLVLADEPTGNLDTHAADAVFGLMRRFNRTLGSAFLIVTHDPRIAERCDRVLHIVDGRIGNGGA